MSQPFLQPVRDSIPKVAGDVAVGEDLEFQRKWWRFERFIWIVFLIVLACDLFGLLGRGWLAKARREAPDHALTLNYERVERASTPSIMTLHFGPSAVHDGQIHLFVSENVVHRLGAQRISPQPQLSELTQGGFTYTFPATSTPDTVEIAMEPLFPGTEHIRLQVVGSDPIEATVFVVP